MAVFILGIFSLHLCIVGGSRDLVAIFFLTVIQVIVASPVVMTGLATYDIFDLNKAHLKMLFVSHTFLLSFSFLEHKDNGTIQCFS